MKIIFGLYIFCMLSSPLLAQQSVSAKTQRVINIARHLFNDKRNATLAYNMTFTQTEKEKFWPVYREYRKAMASVGNKRMAVISDYADHFTNMSESKAKQLLDQHFANEKENIKIKEKYVRKFRKFLPQSKVVRIMQIEHRTDAMIDMKIAEGVPLME
jgi:UTP:GlnB (protein PII) uridylyltransferase